MASHHQACEVGLYRGFESEEQLGQFVRRLASRNTSGKFAYVGDAAIEQHRYASSAAYTQVTRHTHDEVRILHDWMDRLTAPPTTLVDIGPGDGAHSMSLLGALGWKPAQYLLIDFSRRMMDIAAKNIRAALPTAALRTILLDLDATDQPVRQLGLPAGSCALLLGNTLGNVDSPTGSLQLAKNLLGPRKSLLVGCAMLDGKMSAREIESPYHSDAYRSCVLRPFHMLGVPPGSLDLVVEYSPSERAVVASALFTTQFRTRIAGRDVLVKAGETVRCGLSRRFLSQEMIRHGRAADYDVVDWSESPKVAAGTYLMQTKR